MRFFFEPGCITTMIQPLRCTLVLFICYSAKLKSLHLKQIHLKQIIHLIHCPGNLRKYKLLKFQTMKPTIITQTKGTEYKEYNANVLRCILASLFYVVLNIFCCMRLTFVLRLANFCSSFLITHITIVNPKN